MSAGNGRLCKRIIPCLDVANGKTVKGVNFTNLRDIGDPVELGLRYEEEGADELTFLDISASLEARSTVVDLVNRVADNLSIPFTVGGGISQVEDAKRLLASGADKITVNTAAVNNPRLVEEIAIAWGSQCCVVAIDVRAVNPAQQDGSSADVANRHWEVLIKGGRVATGRDAFEWARQCIELGAGEILLTSWDRDGTLSGFDLELTRKFATSLSVPVIASGGARDPDSFLEVFEEGAADAALAASIFHDGTYTIRQVKERLHKAGVPVRLC